MTSIACMLMGMIEIDSIHAFEDEPFLKTITRWSVAVMVAGFAAVGFAVLFNAAGPTAETVAFESLVSGWDWPVALLACVLLLALFTAVALAVHEAVHALCFKLFAPEGSRVRFGAQWDRGMIYVCAEGIVFTRAQYLVAVMAPSVVVTALCASMGAAFGWPVLAGLVAAFHLSGCTGDWFYVWTIARNGKIAACEDTSWGVRFLGEEPAGDNEEAAR